MKRYKVAGTRPVLGHDPGTEFSATLNPAQERRLLSNHSLRVIRKSTGSSGSSTKKKED